MPFTKDGRFIPQRYNSQTKQYENPPGTYDAPPPSSNQEISSPQQNNYNVQSVALQRLQQLKMQSHQSNIDLANQRYMKYSKATMYPSAALSTAVFGVNQHRKRQELLQDAAFSRGSSAFEDSRGRATDQLRFLQDEKLKSLHNTPSVYERVGQFIDRPVNVPGMGNVLGGQLASIVPAASMGAGKAMSLKRSQELREHERRFGRSAGSTLARTGQTTSMARSAAVTTPLALSGLLTGSTKAGIDVSRGITSGIGQALSLGKASTEAGTGILGMSGATSLGLGAGVFAPLLMSMMGGMAVAKRARKLTPKKLTGNDIVSKYGVADDGLESAIQQVVTSEGMPGWAQIQIAALRNIATYTSVIPHGVSLLQNQDDRVEKERKQRGKTTGSKLDKETELLNKQQTQGTIGKTLGKVGSGLSGVRSVIEQATLLDPITQIMNFALTGKTPAALLKEIRASSKVRKERKEIAKEAQYMGISSATLYTMTVDPLTVIDSSLSVEENTLRILQLILSNVQNVNAIMSGKKEARTPGKKTKFEGLMGFLEHIPGLASIGILGNLLGSGVKGLRLDKKAGEFDKKLGSISQELLENLKGKKDNLFGHFQDNISQIPKQQLLLPMASGGQIGARTVGQEISELNRQETKEKIFGFMDETLRLLKTIKQYVTGEREILEFDTKKGKEVEGFFEKIFKKLAGSTLVKSGVGAIGSLIGFGLYDKMKSWFKGEDFDKSIWETLAGALFPTTDSGKPDKSASIARWATFGGLIGLPFGLPMALGGAILGGGIGLISHYIRTFAMPEGGFAGVWDEIVKTFKGDDSSQMNVSNIAQSAMLGFTLGVPFGPAGMFAGAMIGGGLSFIWQSLDYMSKDNSDLQALLDNPIMTAPLAGFLGFQIGAAIGGFPGGLAGALIAISIVSIGGLLTEIIKAKDEAGDWEKLWKELGKKENLDLYFGSILTGGIAGAAIGAAIGAFAGGIGAIPGTIIGAFIGAGLAHINAAFSTLFNKDEDGKLNWDGFWKTIRGDKITDAIFGANTVAGEMARAGNQVFPIIGGLAGGLLGKALGLVTDILPDETKKFLQGPEGGDKETVDKIKKEAEESTGVPTPGLVGPRKPIDQTNVFGMGSLSPSLSPNIPGMKRGGSVWKVPGNENVHGDRYPATLQSGSVVINKAAAKAIGLQIGGEVRALLEPGEVVVPPVNANLSNWALNVNSSVPRSTLPGYKDGGYVWPSRSLPYKEYVMETARKYGLSPDLMAAQIQTESNWNPHAVSHDGAKGLAQFMPGTAKRYDILGKEFDPESSIDAQANYMRDLLTLFQGDTDKALAGYNWGEGNVQRKGMSRMPRETRDYLSRIHKLLGDNSFSFSDIGSGISSISKFGKDAFLGGFRTLGRMIGESISFWKEFSGKDISTDNLFGFASGGLVNANLKRQVSIEGQREIDRIRHRRQTSLDNLKPQTGKTLSLEGQLAMKNIRQRHNRINEMAKTRINDEIDEEARMQMLQMQGSIKRAKSETNYNENLATGLISKANQMSQSQQTARQTNAPSISALDEIPEGLATLIVRALESYVGAQI